MNITASPLRNHSYRHRPLPPAPSISRKNNKQFVMTRVSYTKITPLPSNVPRQLAVELLHAHEEVIKLNPLVTGVKGIETPRDSPNDEYFSQWYEISEIITWGFGMKKKILFKGVFHDQPWGMQSHVYAPMGVDLRNKYRIGGNQPGEPREPRELGVDTPLDGLYLREDVEIVCNIALASFVKKETKDATGKMIARLAKKAELLDEGKLHAMFENGRLKTAKPSAFSDRGDDAHSLAPSSPGAFPFAPGSPSPSMSSAGFGPRLDQRGYGNYHEIRRSSSQYGGSSQYAPAYQQQGYNGPENTRPGASHNMPMINELPGDYYQHQGLQPHPLKPQGQVFRSELPGDNSFSTGTGTPSPQPSPGQAPADFEKGPNRQYHPYATPPQQYANERNHSVSTQGGYHAYANSDVSQRNFSMHGSPRQNPSDWQSQQQSQYYNGNGVGQAISTDEGLTAHRYSDPNGPPYPSSRPPSELHSEPDHQRFSEMSLQSGTSSQQQAGQSSDNAQPTIPPRDPRRGSSAVRSQSSHEGSVSSNRGGGGGATTDTNDKTPSAATCPVCGLFEGDEAAVSHHVSKAHFA